MIKSITNPDTWSLAPNRVPEHILEGLRSGLCEDGKIYLNAQMIFHSTDERIKNRLGASDIRRVVEACLEGNITNIRMIDLLGANIGYKGVRFLSHLDLSNLWNLNLWECNIGDEGAKALANINMPVLVNLSLSHNKIGDAGIKALSQTQFPLLSHLYLRSNNITSVGAKQLAMIEFPNLTKLDICANPTGAVGEKALGNIYAPKITCIQFTKNGYSDTFTETSLIVIRNNPKPLTSQPIATAPARHSNPSVIFSRLFGSNPSTRAASATETPAETRLTASATKKAQASTYPTPVLVAPSAPPLKEANQEEFSDEAQYTRELLCSMSRQLLAPDVTGPDGKPLRDTLKFAALAAITKVLADEVLQSEGASEF